MGRGGVGKRGEGREKEESLISKAGNFEGKERGNFDANRELRNTREILRKRENFEGMGKF